MPEATGGRTDWWAYRGPLAVVFSGLPGGTLVLPVRLPTAPCNQRILDHHLAAPDLWHKVDPVRTRAPQEPGGWRYEAHLMVLIAPYVSPSTRARRTEVAVAEAERVAGIDVNVSNLTIASQVAGGDLRLTRVERDGPAKERDRGRRRRERRRQRAWSGRGGRSTARSTSCPGGRRNAPGGALPPAWLPSRSFRRARAWHEPMAYR